MGATYSSLVDLGHSLWVGKVVPQDGVVHHCCAPSADLRAVPASDLPATGARRKRVVCISDVHGMEEYLHIPACDLLVVAGDILLMGRHYAASTDEAKVRGFAEWLARQPCRAAVVIAGNHDVVYERLGAARVQAIFDAAAAAGGGGSPGHLRYLCDSACTVEGLRVHGTPASYGKSKNAAFQCRGSKRHRQDPFAALPRGMDVVVTHNTAVGCLELRRALQKAAPALHVGGHLHCAYGAERIGGVLSITASVVNSRYKPANPAIVVDVACRG